MMFLAQPTSRFFSSTAACSQPNFGLFSVLVSGKLRFAEGRMS